MNRFERLALALLLLAAAFHLPVKAWGVAVLGGTAGFAADHTALVLAAGAGLLLLRTAPGFFGRAITKLAGGRAARLLIGAAR